MTKNETRTRRIPYVVVDDAEWGETCIVAASRWPGMRERLLDQWADGALPSGGRGSVADPAEDLETWAEREGERDMRGAGSARALREYRRILRAIDTVHACSECDHVLDASEECCPLHPDAALQTIREGA